MPVAALKAPAEEYVKWRFTSLRAVNKLEISLFAVNMRIGELSWKQILPLQSKSTRPRTPKNALNI